MSNVLKFDGPRGEQFVASKPRTLARVMDIDALADEAYRHFDRAWKASGPLSGHAPFIRAMVRAGEAVVAIRVITNEWAGEVEAADPICPDQLPLPGHGFAA